MPDPEIMFIRRSSKVQQEGDSFEENEDLE